MLNKDLFESPADFENLSPQSAQSRTRRPSYTQGKPSRIGEEFRIRQKRGVCPAHISKAKKKLQLLTIQEAGRDITEDELNNTIEINSPIQNKSTHKPRDSASLQSEFIPFEKHGAQTQSRHPVQLKIVSLSELGLRNAKEKILYNDYKLQTQKIQELVNGNNETAKVLTKEYVQRRSRQRQQFQTQRQPLTKMNENFALITDSIQSSQCGETFDQTAYKYSLQITSTKSRKAASMKISNQLTGTVNLKQNVEDMSKISVFKQNDIRQTQKDWKRVSIIDFNSFELKKVRNRTIEDYEDIEKATRRLPNDIVKEIEQAQLNKFKMTLNRIFNRNK